MMDLDENRWWRQLFKYACIVMKVMDGQPWRIHRKTVIKDRHLLSNNVRKYLRALKRLKGTVNNESGECGPLALMLGVELARIHR